jgi:hypothetical protein
MPEQLRKIPPFIKTVGQARGLAPCDNGVRPEDLDERIEREFGPGWHLVWSMISKKWLIVRQWPWAPDWIYQYDGPLTYEGIGHCKYFLELEANPERKVELMKWREKNDFDRHEQKKREFADEIKSELKRINKFRGSIVWPGRRSLVGV